MATLEQIRAYIRNHGLSCLYCGDSNIESGETDTQDYMICRQVRCGKCGREWTDEYTLTSVSIDEAEVNANTGWHPSHG